MSTKSSLSSLKTVGAFLNGRACSDTLLHVLDRAFDHPLPEEERAAMPLAGGIMQHGYQCGMIWGATLAAGAEAYRRFGAGPPAEAKAVAAAQRLLESFGALHRYTDCFDITRTDRSSSTLQLLTYFFLKGGSVRCFRMAARYAPVALSQVNAVLSEPQVDVPLAAPSCSAVLARKMGASDMHAVMAAGFAGGIGLSGGACGALAAAVWITGLKALGQGAAKVDYQAPAALEVVERFLKCADYELECSRIVGRKFESVGDHADYLCQGGCSKLIELLASREG